MTEPVRLAVIDDHPLFREGVTRSLSEIGGFEVVGLGGSSAEAVELSIRHAPDIMLVDISMPGGGLNAIEAILERRPDQKIVMLTVSESGDDVAKAFNRGACGYVLKGVGSRALADILRGVSAGERYVTPSLSSRLLASFAKPASKADLLDDLTAREREILELVASGLSNKRIALRLDLQEKTIKHHMTRILAKLQASNRTEAAMLLRDALG